VQFQFLQVGKGLPSAKLDAELINRTTPTARTRRIFFMVMLLDENGETVLLCTTRFFPARPPLFVFLFGKRKFVVLTSAVQDFEDRTLRAVPGLLGKLRYVALLHNNAGTYSHWGLEKVYGSGGAERAIRSSHGTLIARILKTPLRDLADDLQYSAANAQITDYELLSCLDTPSGNGPAVQSFNASEKHFRSVLHTLSALVQNRAPAIPRDASPLPPPDR
jgi:hypothetical protein